MSGKTRHITLDDLLYHKERRIRIKAQELKEELELLERITEYYPPFNPQKFERPRV